MAMADGYGLFWNSDSGDRKYDAQSFEKWLKKFFTSGVFEGDLQVLASSGMTVQVQTGYSNVNGKVGLFESATNVTLNAANSRYPRIDTIIIERNDVDRVIQIDKVTGAYTGENPQPTAPIWDETQGIYQLVLAQIYVGAGVSSISQEDITDKRTDTDVCGYIAGTVNEMDFSQFTAQFEAYFSTFEATQLAEFEEWFDHMKDQLDSDAAGHLQAEIDATNGNIGTLASLTTDNKTSAVAAINEVDAHADNAQATANTASSKADIVQAQVANSGDIYSASKAYSVGDLCIYNNVLYRCITACSAGSWATNQSCFMADTLVNVVDGVNNTGICSISGRAGADFRFMSLARKGKTIFAQGYVVLPDASRDDILGNIDNSSFYPAGGKDMYIAIFKTQSQNASTLVFSTDGTIICGDNQITSGYYLVLGSYFIN